MFHFVLLSGGAILIGRSYPPPPRPLSVPLAPPRPLVLYTHPLATTTAAAAAHLLFLYYNVRALSGGSDGSGAEAELPAGCRLERVPGWDCFSNELHSSGLYVSVWGTPPFALAGSFPPCARANLLFFSSSFPLLPFPFFVPALLILAARGFRWENHSCQWSPARVTWRILYVAISVRSSSSICRDSFILLLSSSPFVCLLF